ncbi:MAG: helix-turn-helix domain-containing protein [Spirochaetales bacterium]|nr:helix-turn-helix domain-containing protein [Spirochaetales bacterium]
MRDSIKSAITETYKDMIDEGLTTSLTEKDLKYLGINIPDVVVSAEEIKEIRNNIHLSQSVFAKLLNVSVSSVRQWEQGKRMPTGSTKILLELLEKEPHLLDYRLI